MKLNIKDIINADKEIKSLNFNTLNEIVKHLNNGSIRMLPNILPSKGGVYCFWWTGKKKLLFDSTVNKTLLFKGPNQREVQITLNDDWILHHGTYQPISLYVGKTADNLKNRIGLHLQLGTVRTLALGEQCLLQHRKTTSNQMRDRIDRMFINESNTRELILQNIGLSYSILDGDEQAVNRFYAEDRIIGNLLPVFNVDIER